MSLGATSNKGIQATIVGLNDSDSASITQLVLTAGVLLAHSSLQSICLRFGFSSPESSFVDDVFASMLLASVTHEAYLSESWHEFPMGLKSVKHVCKLQSSILSKFSPRKAW